MLSERSRVLKKNLLVDRKQVKERQEVGADRKGGGAALERGHVIEGQVQLLAEGLALQLLSVDFIWRSRRRQ